MNLVALVITSVMILSEAGLAGDHGAGADADARVPETFGSSDIRDWYAPDENTLIISTYAHGAFKGTFMGRCTGVRFAETLGFRTLGPWELDRSTVVVFADGRQCAFRELVRISADQEKAERHRQRTGEGGDKAGN